MHTRKFGNTAEQVSAIGLGCMGMVGWYGKRDDAEALATIHRALDLGINHLDTAAVYQAGDNERFVGEAIRGRRDEVFLATKCGLERSAQGSIGQGSIAADNRPETIRRSCDASLARLGTDHIDLFYLHRMDKSVPLEESVGVMGELVKAGKIRYVGLSEVSPDTLRRAHGIHPVTALQSELSLWTRSACKPSLDACRELGIAFVAYSPLGRGFLTGAITKVADLPEGDTRRNFPRFTAQNFDRNLPIAARLAALAKSFQCTPAQLALAWVLGQWEGILPIPGTKKRKYLEENAEAAELELSPADLATIARGIPEDLVQGQRYPDGMLDTLNV